MSKTKHTPGPLSLLYTQTTYRIAGGGDDMGGRHEVAVVYHDADPRERESNPNASHDAARLVACWNGCLDVNPEAVPDLIAFTEDVRTWLISPDLRRDTIQGFWEKANAALAKAKGGSHD